MARAISRAGRSPTSAQQPPLGLFRAWIKVPEANSQSSSLPGWSQGAAGLTKASELRRAAFLFGVSLFVHSPAWVRVFRRL